MGWKTYLVMYFGTGNGSATEIAKKLELLGFNSSLGPVDFIHEWPNEPSKSEVLALADKVSATLKGTGSVFNLDTHN